VRYFNFPLRGMFVGSCWVVSCSTVEESGLRGRGEREEGKDEVGLAMELWCFCLLSFVLCCVWLSGTVVKARWWLWLPGLLCCDALFSEHKILYG